MKKLLIATLLVAATTTIGATTYANTLQQQGKIQGTTTTTNLITLEEVQNQLEEVQTKLNSNEELTIEEYRETLDYLTEVMPQLVEQNLPVVGDGMEEVFYFLQLEQARKDVEEFASWLDTLEVAQPLSNAKLENILGE